MNSRSEIPKELIEFLQLDIPTPPPRDYGFLDVVNQATRETTICNVYRYFLSQSTAPKLSERMISALLELLESAFEEKGMEKQIDLSEYEVHLEYSTAQGRIDILILSRTSRCAIIIEAKIHHALHNNLSDYWSAIDYPEHQKAGVVLGLYPHSDVQIGHSHFVSLTHTDWLNSVVSGGLPHDIAVKNYIYFQDFVNNMNRITYSNEMTPEVKFYLSHPDKIESAIATKKAALEYVITQLQTVAERLNLSVFGSNDHWRNLWDAEKKYPVYYTVFPHDIITSGGQNITIIIELFGKAIAEEESLRQLLKDDALAKRLNNPHHRRAGYVHFLSTTIQLSPESLNLLAEKIVDTIANDLEPVRQKLLKALNCPLET